MKRSNKATKRVGFVAIVLALIAPSPAAALGAQLSRDDANMRAAARAIERYAMTNKLSEADKSAIRRVPKIAATIIDPDSWEAGQGSTEVGAPFPTIAASGCKRADYWVRARTLLGFTAYVFHQVLEACYNGSNVTSIGQRYAYMSDVDPNFYYRGLTVNSKSPVPTGTLYSTMQGKVENCIAKYGCIGVTYPYVQIRISGSGTVNYTARN